MPLECFHDLCMINERSRVLYTTNANVTSQTSVLAILVHHSGCFIDVCARHVVYNAECGSFRMLEVVS